MRTLDPASWITVHSDDPDIVRRGRTLGVILLVFLTIGLLTTPILLFVPARGVPALSFMFLSSFLTYAVGLMLVRGGSVDLAGAFTGSLVSIVMAASMITRGPVTDTIWFLIIGLLIASFTSSVRVVIFVFCVDLVLLGLLSGKPQLRSAELPLIPSVLSLLAVVASAGSLFAWLSNQAFHRLEEARSQAESANEAKSAFLAMMSHELRTPLNAIIGYSEMLLEDEPETGVEDIERIRFSGTHLLGLISDLLDLSRIESSDLEIASAPVDLPVLLDQVVQSLATQTPAHLSVHTEVKPCPPLLSDGTRLTQLLLHLVENALAFARGDVVLRAEPADGGIQIAVIDDGPGLCPDDLDRIFEAFVQLDGSATRERDGLGIGLTIALRIAELVGGRLSVASKPGKGATFTVWVPVSTGR